MVRRKPAFFTGQQIETDNNYQFYFYQPLGEIATWAVVPIVAEQALGVGQFSCGGDLGSPQHQRLLVEHTGVHEDQHKDRGQAVSLGRHSQRVMLQQGGREVQQGAPQLLVGDRGWRGGVDVWRLGCRLADLMDQIACKEGR